QHGRVGADGEGQADDGHGGEAGAPAQAPRREPQVIDKDRHAPFPRHLTLAGGPGLPRLDYSSRTKKSGGAAGRERGMILGGSHVRLASGRCRIARRRVRFDPRGRGRAGPRPLLLERHRKKSFRGSRRRIGGRPRPRAERVPRVARSRAARRLRVLHRRRLDLPRPARLGEGPARAVEGLERKPARGPRRHGLGYALPPRVLRAGSLAPRRPRQPAPVPRRRRARRAPVGQGAARRSGSLRGHAERQGPAAKPVRGARAEHGRARAAAGRDPEDAREARRVIDRVSRVRYRVLAFTFALAVVTYLDRICISAAAPFMMADLGLTMLQMTVVFSAFTLAYSLFEVPSGWRGDVVGARRVLTRIVLWWSAFTMLTGAAWSLRSLVAIRFLFGAGEAGAFPNIQRSFSRWFPARERGRATGVIFL